MDTFYENDTQTIELHHTHFVLFDNGELQGYLGDNRRSEFVDKICEKCENKCKTIIKVIPKKKDIEYYLRKVYPLMSDKDIEFTSYVEQLENIMKPDYQHYLNIHQVSDEKTTIEDTMFNAICSGMNKIQYP
ncbi:unnamed protein product [Didymodactylos carnosus]|uniref:Uncharacterized protein n=1 Tax=Didymodactylos carnosus TaxID=1234261 RepID=A0A8S2F2V5_9BILA|nr:unnamed protein product [Didymodactylos carnosus]CAF4138388.1 unnamed protein product [Didymodactylos carnosus]